ncbi:MAG: hypothetical protein ACJA2P_001072 [Rhodoferax sp.]|jgi:hypothetical protein
MVWTFYRRETVPDNRTLLRGMGPERMGEFNYAQALAGVDQEVLGIVTAPFLNQ